MLASETSKPDGARVTKPRVGKRVGPAVGDSLGPKLPLGEWLAASSAGESVAVRLDAMAISVLSAFEDKKEFNADATTADRFEMENVCTWCGAWFGLRRCFVCNGNQCAECHAEGVAVCNACRRFFFSCCKRQKLLFTA